MKTQLKFKWGATELTICGFDGDKEMEFSIENDDTKTIYLSPNNVNEIISHLSERMDSIHEPVSILNELHTRKILRCLENLVDSIPKESNDADWWPDELKSAVQEAETLIIALNEKEQQQ